MKEKITCIVATLLMIGAMFLQIMGLTGCQKVDSSENEMQTVPREPAYASCYPVVGTSQSACWDGAGNKIVPESGEAFYGQDSQFPGTKPVYTKSSDGCTVKDEVTGLTWQKSHDDGTYYWGETQDVVSNLNNQNYGSHNDWRLPTIKELYSLWNASAGWPYIDTNYFDLTYSSEEELSHAIFWSSDKYTGLVESTLDTSAIGKEMAFGVNFGTGHIKAYTISFGPKHLVRCVRGNLSYGVNMFQDNTDGTVSDLATGLMWAQSDSTIGMEWKEALAYVQTQNAANYLGHSDWRLPNTKELQGIVDYTRSPGATDSANVGPAIDPLFRCTSITNESGYPDYPWYWTGTSAIAQSDGQYSFAWYVAFGRAGDEYGKDLQGAGAVRFASKASGASVVGEGNGRTSNYVRLVRTIQ